ncbi:MAG: hypothetical protein IJL92_05125 [Thermoguttaceae bacterium]|nr:hypothetical protein [Thermoguttaceae bacterium]
MKKTTILVSLGVALICLVAGMSTTNLCYADDGLAKPDAILARMTVEEKVGQMVCVAFRAWEGEGKNGPVTELNDQLADAIKKYNLGGICLFAPNCEGTEQTVRLTDQIQNAARQSSAGIPMLITVDQEGGYVTRFTTGTSTPGNMALAATGDVKSAEKAGQIIGQELMAMGFNTNFGPSVDVNNNANNPIIGVRSFSDDPNVVAKFGAAYVQGLHLEKAIACVKHFPGHGDTDVDSHTGFPKIDKSLDELMEMELVPFAACAKTTDMVMTAHIQFPKVEKTSYISIKNGEEVKLPATLSKVMIHDVLREKLGFDGVVCTDSLGMAAISENFKPMDSAKFAILADVDILLMPVVTQSEKGLAKLGDYLNGIVKMVKDGEIPESELDDSVLRILKMKEKYGVLDPPTETLDKRVKNALAVVGSKANHDAEWDIAVKAVTAYKGGDALPFKLDEKANVLYLSPNSALELSARYAIERLKKEGTIPESVTLETINYSDKAGKDAARKALDKANVVVLCTRTTGLGMLDDSDPENVSAIFVNSTIKKAHELGKKVALVSAHLPYDAGYYAGADVTLLAYNPSGMTSLPTDFEGATEKFGANVPAAIYVAFSGAKPTGVCPVNLDVFKR